MAYQPKYSQKKSEKQAAAPRAEKKMGKGALILFIILGVFIVPAASFFTGKLMLVQRAAEAGTPIICCMGTGNKLDASAFEVSDISKTSMCPLARIMRKELAKRGIKHLKVVYSKEEALTPTGWEQEAAALGKRQIPGSVAFVPGTAGLILAGEIIKDLAQLG